MIVDADQDEPTGLFLSIRRILLRGWLYPGLIVLGGWVVLH